MGWVTNFIKRIVTEVATEVLEPRLRAIVREEMHVAFEREWLPRIRALVREEMRVAFEQEWFPRIQALVREEMRVAFEQEWFPRIQALVREEMRVAFEQEWFPRIQALVSEKVVTEVRGLENRMNQRFDAVDTRFDALMNMFAQFMEARLREWSEMRADVERLKARAGLTGGESQ